MENVDRSNDIWGGYMVKSTTGHDRIPYEYRPVVGFVDVPVMKRRAGAPNCYYVEGSKVVLIHDDEIAEYEFTDPSSFQDEVALLERSSIARVDWAKGWLKVTALIVAFVLVLQLLVWAIG